MCKVNSILIMCFCFSFICFACVLQGANQQATDASQKQQPKHVSNVLTLIPFTSLAPQLLSVHSVSCLHHLSIVFTRLEFIILSIKTVFDKNVEDLHWHPSGLFISWYFWYTGVPCRKTLSIHLPPYLIWSCYGIF